ncbi:hypothetical protein K0A97_01750 [Patescibacteria group bacterium]|nr:hypothetical protein [Patescibacteria group bacterium]
MKKTKFLRRIWGRYSKLGKRRKKKQIWRRPTGRDNKMREKRKGYPAVVSIGYKTPKSEKKKIIFIRNVNDLKNISKEDLILLGNVGKKKKLEILKKASEEKIKFSNINEKKFLKEIEKKKKKKELSSKKSANLKESKKEVIKKNKEENKK